MKRRIRRNIPLALCVPVLLLGCSSKSSSGSGAAADGKPQAIDGYGKAKLGMSINDMIGQFGRGFFHPAHIDECVANMATNGCFIAQNPDAAPFATIEGNPFRLVSSFNPQGKLTDVKLLYRKEGDTSRDQCRAIYETTLDWATATYGKFYLDDGAQDTRLEDLKTPKNNVYRGGGPIDQVFASVPLYTVAVHTTDPTTKPAITQRYAWPMVMFTSLTGTPVCQVSLYFSEPDTVERRPDQDSRM